LKILFNNYDDILLDFEGKEWEFSLEELKKLTLFLEEQDQSKKLIYTVAVKSSLWNRGKNFDKYIYLVKMAKKMNQLTFCLVTGHRVYLNDSEKILKSKSLFKKFLEVINKVNFEKKWFLGSDNIENIAGSIAQADKNCSLILLQSKGLLKVISKLKSNFDLNFNQLTVYGLWIDDYIDDFSYDYLERRNITDIDINNLMIHEYTVNLNSTNEELYNEINQIFLLYKISLESFETNQLIIESSKNLKIESSTNKY
jgi:KaiC/GvpD/RAD55 family RecA-like ATPase